MLRILLFCLLLLSGCATIKAPDSFVYQEISGKNFDLVTWQKITSADAVYKVYIEGDGYAFNSHGMPSSDPTPKGELMRELAFNDNSPNVIYLARPCQYKLGRSCSTRYWTTARFAPEVIQDEYVAIKKTINNRPVILIGFSGGAQIAGILAANTDLNVKKIITIAGNLDHKAWTKYHHLPDLTGSLNAADFKTKLNSIPQKHYIGEKDKVIPPILTQNLIDNPKLIVKVKGASHNKGWDIIYPSIWQEL